jgi:actin-related protein
MSVVPDRTIVLDNGTLTLKVGYAGENQPRFTIPMVVGTPKAGSLMVGIQTKEYFVGFEALAKQNLLDLVNPIEDGVIMNWQYIEQLWYEVFVNNFHIDIEEFCVLQGEKPLLPLSSRETMIQLVFETFKAGGFFVCQQSVLALFSSGRTTGIVLDAGEGIHHIVPVYEGYTIPHAVIKSELSGAILTDFMRQLMIERTPSAADLPINCVRTVKEKLCYVPLDFQAEIQSAETMESTKMPNGKLFEAGNERFQCPEVLFDPSLNQKTCEGIHQSLFNSIMRCDIDIRKDLYKNVVLCGGSAMFQGFSERIEKEVIALAPPSMKVRVFGPPERRNSVWIGGSVLGARDFFRNTMAVSRAEFQEVGASIVHRKCHS